MSNDDFKEFSLIQFAKEDHAIWGYSNAS
jgi:hypothetical protein